MLRRFGGKERGRSQHLRVRRELLLKISLMWSSRPERRVNEAGRRQAAYNQKENHEVVSMDIKHVVVKGKMQVEEGTREEMMNDVNVRENGWRRNSRKV